VSPDCVAVTSADARSSVIYRPSRRRFLQNLAAPVVASAFRPSNSQAAEGLVWAPATHLGINLIYANLWSDGSGHVPIPPREQHTLFAQYGVSFIRGMINWYRRGSVSTYTYLDWPFATTGADFAIRTVQSVRPLAGDPSQLELTCEGSSYNPPPGEKIILSRDVVYHDGRGQVVLRAKVPLVLTGSTPGAIDARYRSTTSSTYSVSVGRRVDDVGLALLGDTDVLHMNFYKAGRTPRGQIAAYAEAIDAWVAAGFAFDHAGMHDQLGTLINDYGIDNINVLRRQEWEYFASRDWSPRSVLISNANEIVWGGDVRRRGAEWAGYKSWFKDFVYPEMRHYFPHHTLAFGLGNGDSCLGMQFADWWPSDPNTMLAVHGYLEPGWYPFPVDGTSEIAMTKLLDFVDENSRRLRIPQVYWQEYGLKVKQPNRNERLAAFTKAILQRGYYACSWGADTNYDYYRLATKQNGLWTPLPDSLGAFMVH
jgi:hypothetical protein